MYIEPEKVDSPRGRWKLLKVLWNSRSADKADGSASIALGLWDGEPCLGVRWNGDEGEGIGNPQSRGLPTWFIVPSELNEAILALRDIPPDMRARADALFEVHRETVR